MTELKHTIEAFLNPACLVVLCLLWGCFKSFKHKAPGRHALLTGFLILFITSTGPLPYTLSQWLEHRYPINPKLNLDVQDVVILGGGQASFNQYPSDLVLTGASLKRTLTGLRVFKALPNARLVLSGGGYGHDIPEAIRMYDILTQCGLTDEQVFIESHSMNTAMQAKALKKILPPKPFYLVTSAIHMPRSIHLLEQEGLSPIAHPSDFTFYWHDERWQKYYLPNGQNIVYTSIVMHELLGMTWQWLVNL